MMSFQEMMRAQHRAGKRIAMRLSVRYEMQSPCALCGITAKWRYGGRVTMGRIWTQHCACVRPRSILIADGGRL